MRRVTVLILALLSLHAVLFLLASTNLSIVTGPPFNWEYFRLHHETGWGYEYASSYTVSIVVLFVFAYLTGLVAYLWVCFEGLLLIGGLGALLSFAGLVSFVIEASHWAVSHNRSLILSAPIALLVLFAITAWRLVWTEGTAQPTALGRQ